jgi:hypothetical protein
VAVEALDSHAVIKGRGVLLGAVDPSGQVGPILDCPGDDGRLVGRVEAPVGHQALRYDGRDALVKGGGLEGYPGAPEKAPYGYAVRVDPALVLQELFPVDQDVRLEGKRRWKDG